MTAIIYRLVFVIKTLSVLCEVVTKFLYVFQLLYTLQVLEHYVW